MTTLPPPILRGRPARTDGVSASAATPHPNPIPNHSAKGHVFSQLPTAEDQTRTKGTRNTARSPAHPITRSELLARPSYITQGMRILFNSVLVPHQLNHISARQFGIRSAAFLLVACGRGRGDSERERGLCRRCLGTWRCWTWACASRRGSTRTARRRRACTTSRRRPSRRRRRRPPPPPRRARPTTPRRP